MEQSVILSWHDYFMTVAGISATLAGLLFVGVTISLNHMLLGYGYLSRAFTALFLQFQVLLLGLFGIVPGQPAFALGLEFIVTGLAFLTGISIFARNFAEGEHSHVLGSIGPRAVRAVLAYAATLMPVMAGVGLVAHMPGALYLLIPGEVACLYLSFGNAWVFAVEIPRRAGGQARSDAAPAPRI